MKKTGQHWLLGSFWKLFSWFFSKLACWLYRYILQINITKDLKWSIYCSQTKVWSGWFWEMFNSFEDLPGNLYSYRGGVRGGGGGGGGGGLRFFYSGIRPPGSPFVLFWDIQFWLADPIYPIYTNFEGGARAEKTQFFWSTISKKFQKTLFLARFFQNFACGAENLAETGWKSAYPKPPYLAPSRKS